MNLFINEENEEVKLTLECENTAETKHLLNQIGKLGVEGKQLQEKINNINILDFDFDENKKIKKIIKNILNDEGNTMFNYISTIMGRG